MLIVTSVFAYFGYDRVMAKTKPQSADVLFSQDIEGEKITTDSVQPVQPAANVQIATPMRVFTDVQLLTQDIDWSLVSACLTSPNLGCVCYGKAGQRLVIPKESCELAVTSGWDRKKA